MAKNVALDHSDCVVGNAVGPYGSSHPESEVCFDDFYKPARAKNGCWDKVIRLKDPSIRHTYAQAMIKACNNNYIRYNQGTSASGYSERRQVYNWIKDNGKPDISTLNTVKYCDCSSLASALLLYVNIDVGTPSTYGIIYEDVLEKTGKFITFETSDYTQCAENLLIGDILVYNNPSYGSNGAGHAAVVVYSTYDKTSEDYVDEPVFERDINAGRYTTPGNYASAGPTRPEPTVVPENLCQLSDFELFLLGAYITGGGAVTLRGLVPAKSVDVQPIE